jgi:hypothetical protein
MQQQRRVCETCTSVECCNEHKAWLTTLAAVAAGVAVQHSAGYVDLYST